MSLEIEANKVVGILLAGGSWLSVKKGSFDIDEYEFVEKRGGDMLHMKGGNGFSCQAAVKAKKFVKMAGLLSSVVAVVYE